MISQQRMILNEETHLILLFYFGTFRLKSFQVFQNTCNIGGLILEVGNFEDDSRREPSGI